MAGRIIDIIVRGVDQTKQGLTAPIRSLDDLGKAAARIAPAVKLAVTATAGAFAYMVKQSIDLADQMAKTSQKIGISVESLSALKHAASLSGVEFESLVNGLKFANKNMADMAAGTGDARLAFMAMGVSVKDSSGQMKTTEALLGEVADKFMKYEDGANKTAIAMRIFGKAGADLIPLLNQGSAGIKDMMVGAEKLGLVIDTKTARASEEFNDNMKSLKDTASGAALVFAAEVVPSMASAAGAMVQWAKESGAAEKTGKVLAETIKVLAASGLLVASAFAAAGTAIGGLFSIIATGVTKGPVAAWENAKDVFAELDSQLDESTLKMVALQGAGTKAGEKVAAAAGGKGSTPFLVDEVALKKAAADKKKLIDELAKYAFDSAVEYDKAIIDAHALTNKMELDGIRETIEKRKALEQDFTDFAIQKAMEYDAGWADGISNVMSNTASLFDQLSEQYENAFGSGNVASAIAAINEGLGEQWAILDEGQTKIDAYRELAMDANMTIGKAATEIGMATRDMMIGTLTSIVTGAQKASDAFKNIGRAAIGMVVEYALRWASALLVMEATGNTAKAAEVVLAKITGTSVAVAWAPAAALVSLATLGANAAPAAAALAGTTALAGTLALAGAAHGGLSNVPAESTFLLQRGERVVSPKQNEDLTDFLEGGKKQGGGNVTQLILDGRVLASWFHDASREGVIQLRPA